MDKKYMELIVAELVVKERQIMNTIDLLEADNTIPFIARYRKENTGYLDEDQLRDIQRHLEYYHKLNPQYLQNH